MVVSSAPRGGLALTFVFLSNLQSAANWQTRAQVRQLLLRRTPTLIFRPPPVGAPFEKPADVVGAYGDASDPILIALVVGLELEEVISPAE